MDIFTLIESKAYMDAFKKNGVVYRKYPKLNLMVVKLRYGTEFNKELPWLNYCRGLVIDYSNHKVVFVPPVKSIEVDTLNELPNTDTITCSELIDGTMINVFNYNNKWLMSTRSNIGCDNKWSSTTFKDMFYECSSNFNFESLNTEHTYSFVVRHKKNRIITPVKDNDIILVEMRNNGEIINELPNSKHYSVNNRLNIANISEIDYPCKGLTMTTPNGRYKWVSDTCKFIQMIKPNTNNSLLDYLLLRNSGHLTKYLQYFPENRHIYKKHREKIHDLTKQLLYNYKNVFVYKTIDLSDVPFALKPFVYELHGIYLKNQKGISWEDVKEFVYQLEPKRICFAINNM